MKDQGPKNQSTGTKDKGDLRPGSRGKPRNADSNDKGPRSSEASAQPPSSLGTEDKTKLRGSFVESVHEEFAGHGSTSVKHESLCFGAVRK
jgi:hypothetical protein